jgi:hypothetical protein
MMIYPSRAPLCPITLLYGVELPKESAAEAIVVSTPRKRDDDAYVTVTCDVVRTT